MTNEQSSGQKHKIFHITKKILLYSFVTVSLLGVGMAGVGTGVLAAYTKDEKVRTKADYENQLKGWTQTSYAYFKDAETGENSLIGAMHTEQDRVLVKKLEDVSPYLLKAFIYTEDHKFYEHNGIVLSSILRAAFQKILGEDVQTGGSTITQQLVKNEILSDRDKTLERKAKEIVNALRLERFFDKKTIFVKYLNSLYFGKGANSKHMYGVAAAARGLFNKDVKNLNLAEAAYIAGMVQRPNAYNPFYGDKATEKKHLQAGTERMKLVLEQMLEHDYITKEEYEKATKTELKFANPSQFSNAYTKYPFIISAIESKAIDILRKMDEKYHPEKAKEKNTKDYTNLVSEGGLRIYTTIDEQIYKAMNESIKDFDFPTRKYNGVTVEEQVGAVMIDNKTGAILSFYAGNDFKKNQKNHAFDAKNQPGSSIKPLLAYGPALNEGIISSNSIIIDEPLKKAGSSDVYVNANGKYSGPVTATQALKWSYNIPAVKIFRQLGKETAFNYIKQMDIIPHEHDGEALVLGGATIGFTVEQMTGSFAMIANNGEFNKPHLIEKITDADGNVLYDYNKENKPKQIFKPQVAYTLTKMMEEVVNGGTAGSIGYKTSGYNIAGKTGTTSSQYDLWFVGYSPEISLGVWSGYDYNFRANSSLAMNAWAQFFNAAAKVKPNVIKKGSEFQDPGGSVASKCFECDKVPKEKEKDEKKNKNNENHHSSNGNHQNEEQQKEEEKEPEKDEGENSNNDQPTEENQPNLPNPGNHEENHSNDGPGLFQNMSQTPARLEDGNENETSD